MASKRRRRYEESKEDISEDKRGAKRLGISLKVYEKSGRDKAEDKRGQARLDRRK